MNATQVMTEQENIDFNISTIKKYNKLYSESTSIGEKENYIDHIHSAKMALVKYYGFTWEQVEQIA